MRTLALIGLSTTLAVLSSCGFAAGSLTGNALFGDESYDIGYDMDADRRRFTVTDSGIVVVPRGVGTDTRAEEMAFRYL